MQSPKINNGNTNPLACLALGNTCANRATNKTLRPATPVFETPTMKAPSTPIAH